MPGAIAMGAELCAILEDDLAVIQALLQRPKRVQLMRMRGLFAATSFRSRSSGAEKRTFVLVEGLMYAPCLRMSRSSSVISACSSRGDPVMRESTQLARRCCFSLYPLMRVKPLGGSKQPLMISPLLMPQIAIWSMRQVIVPPGGFAQGQVLFIMFLFHFQDVRTAVFRDAVLAYRARLDGEAAHREHGVRHGCCLECLRPHRCAHFLVGEPFK